MSELKGQVAVVTGGSTPLAEAIAVGLARVGVRVVVSGPVAERLDALVAAVATVGGQALAVPGPIDTLEQAGALVASAIQSFGRLDLVIWVTPFWNGGFIHEHSVAVWDRVLASNLREPFLLLRTVLPHRAGRGPVRSWRSGPTRRWRRMRAMAPMAWRFTASTR